MDDKAEAFTCSLLGDIFGCYAEAIKLNIKIPAQQDEKRFVPEKFYGAMIAFSEPFIDKLTAEMSQMTVLLFYHEDFFKRFTNSVCLKLIKRDDPEVAFLKVTAFILAIISLSFFNQCYRSLDDIPTLLTKLLQEHISTKFYEEGRFEDIVEKSVELKGDKKWCDSTLEEMRTSMNDSLNTELAATRTTNAFEPDRSKITIADVRSKRLESESDLCPYCGGKCLILLKAFFKPKIHYKPECKEM